MGIWNIQILGNCWTCHSFLPDTGTGQKIYGRYFDTYEIAFFILGFSAINYNERILYFLHQGVEKSWILEIMGYDAFQFGRQNACLW